MLGRLARTAVDQARQRSSDTLRARYLARRTGSFRVLHSQRPGEVRIACRPTTLSTGCRATMVTLREDSTDWSTFKDIFVREAYRTDLMAHAPAIRAAYAEILDRRQTPLILDIGANIGLAALYFQEQYPEATIVAVEPAASNVELLRRNCADHPHIVTRAAGIAALPGRLVLTNHTGGADAFRTRYAAGGDTDTIEAVTVAELLHSYPIESGHVPFIAKIDVEGFEQDLFATNSEWVDQFPILIVELHDWMIPGRATSRNFLRCVSDLDRDFVYIGENVFSFSNRLLTHDRSAPAGEHVDLATRMRAAAGAGTGRR